MRSQASKRVLPNHLWSQFCILHKKGKKGKIWLWWAFKIMNIFYQMTHFEMRLIFNKKDSVFPEIPFRLDRFRFFEHGCWIVAKMTKLYCVSYWEDNLEMKSAGFLLKVIFANHLKIWSLPWIHMISFLLIIRFVIYNPYRVCLGVKLKNNEKLSGQMFKIGWHKMCAESGSINTYKFGGKNRNQRTVFFFGANKFI